MKRTLSFVLTLVLLIGLVPLNVLATSTDNMITLDSVAWEKLTYRDIFITNNEAYLDGFDNRTFSPYIQNTGINTITTDACYTGPYSLAAFGSTSQQIKSEVSLPVGDYFIASKVYCTRYVAGELGVCLHSTTVGVTEVTNGFVTASGIISAVTSGRIFIGSIHSADLDGYVDDTVVVDMSIFTNKPIEAEMTTMYEQYVEIVKAVEREEVPFTEQEMLDAFVVYMNEKSASIGMTNSAFVDPVGIDNITTAADLLRLVVYAYTNYEDLNGIWSQSSHTITVSGEKAREQTVASTVIKPALEDYYHILGGKTGTLSKFNARNLAVILEIPESDDCLAVVALYADGLDTDADNRFEAVRQIADAALAKYYDSNVDNSATDVCCAGAIACLLPADGVDMDDLDILYEKDSETQRVPASVTKVLAAICALDYMDDLEQIVTYSEFDTQIGDYYAKDFYPGDCINFEDALYAMMLPSSNVTACMVARVVGELMLNNSHTHTYETAITAPTCTQQGYTTYTCDCGDSYVDDYTDAAGHRYKNGVCIACSIEHSNLANFEGKVISILGDSISTFSGYIPTADGFNLEHLARYPQENLLTDVNETWWMQVITKLDAKLGINDSWRGATVSGGKPVTTGSTGENAAMGNLQRIKNLGANVTPDVILFYGGTNDLAHVSKVGTFDAETAPSMVDLTTTKWDNLADGYVHTLLRLQYFYPDAQIIALLPTYTSSYYSNDKLAEGNAVLAAICKHYGVTYVDLRDCGISTGDLPDGIHPDATGMEFITEAVMDVLLNECEVKNGENVVHSVSYKLTGAECSLGYYKGVTHGKPFDALITGEEVKVTVTMGGMNITNIVYANGAVDIEEVTGDIIVIAEGRVKNIYEDHLQQLPQGLCAGSNLWMKLEHDAQYYTDRGWGIHSSGTVYSVTFPVCAGDQIYATSFGAAENNGSSINGIRVTWFDDNGVLDSVSTDKIYSEFSNNGYLTAPVSAVAVNIPMWNNSDENEIYILNREHCYENGFCLRCGAAQPGPVIVAQPENVESVLGERFTFTVEAEGEDLTYQWYYKNVEDLEFAKTISETNVYSMTMKCNNDGQKVYCVVSDAYGNQVISDVVTLNLVGEAHKYKSVVTSPSCITQGYTSYVCEYCSDSYVSDYVNALGHTLVQHEGKAPTCTETGWNAYGTCVECGYTTYKALETLGHNLGSWKVTKTVTCTEDGVEQRECNRCDHSETRNTEATGHKYEIVVTAPTCENRGYTTHTCKCGDSYIDSYTDVLGHDFKNYVSDNNATCIEDGTKTAKCECCEKRDTVQDGGSAKGHSYESMVIEPTCETEGCTIYLCIKCLANYKDDEKEKLTHQWKEVIDSPATTEQNGLKHEECLLCGDRKNEGTVIEKIPVNPPVVPPTEEEPGNEWVPLTKEEKILAAKLGLSAEGAKELQAYLTENDIPQTVTNVTAASIRKQKTEENKYASYGTLFARAVSTTKKKITLRWKEVKGADGYIIYGNKCGTKNRYKMIKQLKASKTSYTHSKREKGTYYKYMIVAYKMIEGKKVTIGISKTIHATTADGKYGNAKAVQVNRTKITVKKGKHFTIKASSVKKDRKIKAHRAIAFESSNKKVAVVNAKGRITGKKKGTCYIYVYAQNGMYKKIRVTVK